MAGLKIRPVTLNYRGQKNTSVRLGEKGFAQIFLLFKSYLISWRFSTCFRFLVDAHFLCYKAHFYLVSIMVFCFHLFSKQIFRGKLCLI